MSSTPQFDLPKHDALFWPVVNAFRQLDGSADNEQLVEKVIEILGLPDTLTAIPHKSGPQSEIGYRIAWVKSWLKWGGMLDNPQRAVWVLTSRGREATEAEVNDVRVRRRAASAVAGKPVISASATPNTVMTTTADQEFDEAPATEELEEFADDAWQNVLLDVIKGMKAPAFERLSRQILLGLGFSHVEIVGRSNDGGVDLLGTVNSTIYYPFGYLRSARGTRIRLVQAIFEISAGQCRAEQTREFSSRVAVTQVRPTRKRHATAFHRLIWLTAHRSQSCSKTLKWALKPGL